MLPRAVVYALAALASASGHPIGSGNALFAKFAPSFRTGAGREASAQGWTFGADWRPVVDLETGTDAAHEVELSDSEVDDSDAGHPYMAANGHVRGHPGSEFMMKGTADAMYGWMLLADEGRAFEYTTGPDGEVSVDEVPVERVRPSPCGAGGSAGAAEEHDADARAGAELEAHEDAYAGEDIRYLQSQPGADAVLLIDMDVYFRNKRSSDAVVRYDKEYFFDAWRATAAGFSMFNLNVVTDTAVYEQTPIRKRVKACLLNEEGRSYANLNTFGSNRCGSWNFRDSTGYGLGRTVLHEVGHQMGLSHDGQPGLEYWGGLREYRWVPIMGNFWTGTSWGSRALYQWSKGEYNRANQREDDLRLIGRYVSRRADDIVGTRPLAFGGDGLVRVAANRGKITDQTDSDSWTFTVGAGGGRVDLVIDRTEYVGGAMLDVDATLRDGRGNVVARSNPKADRRAFIDEVVAGGEYVLVIRGGAEGTPRNGFSAYSSLGNYGISGTVTNVGPTPPPTPTPPTPAPPTPVPGAEYLTLRADDGRTFTGEPFGFLSDGYTTYPDRTDKEVTLEGDCELRWTSFDIEDSDACVYDYIRVTDGRGSSQKYCGSALPPTSTYAGSVTVALHSDEAVQGNGFDLEFVCSAPPPTPAPTPLPTPAPPTPVPGADYLTLRADDGRTFEGARFGFLADGYSAYPDRTDKEVTLEGDCELRWTSFDIEDSDACVYDYIRVTDGRGSSQKYCGSALTPTSTYAGSVTVALHSDEAVQGNGFDLEFRCTAATTPEPTTASPPTSRPPTPPPTLMPVTPQPTPLPTTAIPATPVPTTATPVETPAPWAALTLRRDGGRTVAATAGTVSDGWEAYPVDTERSVTVRGASCAVRFTALDVENSDRCEWDSVEVLSGGVSLGRFCGDALPQELLATGGSFTVVLRSDAAVVGSGFALAFACDGATLPPAVTPVPNTPVPTPVPPPTPERITCSGKVTLRPGGTGVACGLTRGYDVTVSRVELWTETGGFLCGAPRLRFDLGSASRSATVAEGRWVSTTVDVRVAARDAMEVSLKNENFLVCDADVWVRLTFVRTV